jgi:hypothetical protein
MGGVWVVFLRKRLERKANGLRAFGKERKTKKLASWNADRLTSF